MQKKRDRLQVIYDILKAVQNKNGKIKPTHILYKSNLSHEMMSQYISELLKKGLLSESPMKNSRTYSLTDKGYEYLSKYQIIVDFVESFGLGERTNS